MTTAVAEGLYRRADDGVRLIAGRRKADGEMKFPMPSGADAALFDPVELATEGKLWSYTVQRFRPKTPPYIGADDETTFQPFALGYVEFPGQVIVEGRIVGADPRGLEDRPDNGGRRGILRHLHPGRGVDLRLPPGLKTNGA